MKVLHVIPRYWNYTGGAELYFQEIGERLAREGNDVFVYTTDAWDLEHFWLSGKRRIETRAEEHNGVHIERFPVERLPLSRFTYPALRRAMAAIARLPVSAAPILFQLARWTPRVPALERALAHLDESFDLVHAGNFPLDAIVYAAYRFARKKKIPLIVTPFTHLGEAGKRHVSQDYTMPHQIEMLRNADAVIVQTDLEKEALARHGIPRAKMRRVGMGINPAALCGGDAARFRQRYDIDTPVVFTLGTTVYEKGMFHLVQAMEKLWAQGRAATLVIAGPLTTPFQKFFDAQSARVKQNTRVLGFIPPDENRNDLLAAGDVFALPSRTDSFGAVYLEAWFYRKPVIGARAGGVVEVIDEGRDGFLINFGDTDALAARIEQLLDDRALAQSFGEAGRAKVLAQHTWDRKYALVRGLYQDLAR